ncbi:hypothetical protein MSG28_016209 [Choristoneura fumiferana]|uniref:Uncharacterized protein n=1 Tax=Choristoneura fumiferana TaxID=7141 RepID=A0ACC0K5Y7_CHOFU|nr:hypothetical protein MSG28_016209 [Choristoneura fumiferana]
MKYAKIALTLLLCSSPFVGDYVVFKSKFSSSQVFRAFSDSIVHAIIGFLSSLVFFSQETSVMGYAKLYNVILCTLISSFIDVDHVFVARSLQWKLCIQEAKHIHTILDAYSSIYKSPYTGCQQKRHMVVSLWSYTSIE